MAAKRILICLDGTGNDPSDAKQKVDKEGKMEDDNISNVLKLHLLAGGRLDNVQLNAAQHSYYYSGVGTRGTIFRRALASAFARLEPKLILKDAYDDLCGHYQVGDELFIFGFSRGAAIARRLASQISREGVVVGRVKHEPHIKMLGVWDTVAAIGVPNLDDSEQPVSDVVFENGTIADKIDHAFHLAAVDETRLAFRPTLMNFSPRVSEIWFPGVHSDVGGGYRLSGLSDLALKFMMDKARDHGVAFIQPSAIAPAALSQGKHKIDLEDVAAAPDARDRLHVHVRDEKVASVTLKPRNIHVTVGDKPSADRLPILHHSVIERIKGDSSYRPVNLKELKHQVLHADGSLTQHGGLEEFI